MSSEPELSVVVTTHNRRRELLRALDSIWDQDVAGLEVIVIDDGSDDGSAEAVELGFPETRVIRSVRRGLIAQRNRGAHEARAPVFGLIDDDCVLKSRRSLAEGLGAFDHPRVGAVVLPLVDHDTEQPLVRNLAPDADGVYVTDTYAGAASLIRRDAFLAIGGYRAGADRGEDSDHARRMLQSGLVVRVIRAPEVHHYVSPNRARRKDVFLQSRTQVLATFWSLPLRMLPRRAALSVGHGMRHRQTAAAVRGVASGVVESLRRRGERDPLSPPLARSIRRMESERLRRRYSMRIEDIEPHLPELPREPVRAPGAHVESG